MTTELITERLKIALECGSAQRLRALLASWSESELKELRRDLRFTYHTSVAMLDSEYRASAMNASNRTDQQKQLELYEAYRKDREALVEVCMEIDESVRFYLDRASPKKEAIQ